MRNTLTVNNIKCGGCETSVKDGLSKIEGVANIYVDASTGEVAFDANNETALDKVRRTLHNMGYTESDPNLLDTAKSYMNCMIGRIKQ